MKFDPYP